MSERLDDRPFELLSATVAATIAAHAAHLPAWLSLAAFAIVALRAWQRRMRTGAVSVWIRLPLTGLLLVGVIALFGNVFGREPGTVLGCGLLALKMLEAERVRDARVALGFCAFVLMSALLFTQTLPFTLAICAVLVLLLAALASLQPAALPTHRPLRALLMRAVVLLAAGLPLAAAAFVLVPRLGSPMWGSPGADAAARTGLSERMAPGEMSELLIDESPAFRVRFDGALPRPGQRYFRTLVLWDFDGAAWTRERGRGFAATEQASSEGAPVDYSITLEATDRRWLPALDLPLDAPTTARLGSDRVLIANEPVAQPREYRLRSALAHVLQPTLSPRERARALDLPDGFDPKARALAQSWRAAQKTDEDIARAALDLFHASFTYTLNAPLLGRDSVDDFLFGTQRGFCEHYASAFVFLMRAAGIPARVVTGYQGGWWNADDGYLLVRQSDAHAWAEIWMPQRGWQRVDPTAAVSPARTELGAAAANDAPGWAQSEWMRSLRNQFDFVNRLWTESIIRFDLLRQKGMLLSLGLDDADGSNLLFLLSAALGVALVLATLWALRRERLREGDRLDTVWAAFGRRLARRGLGFDANEGPLAWLDRLQARSPSLAGAVAPLVHEYAQLRYATAEPPRKRIDALARLLRRIAIPRSASD